MFKKNSCFSKISLLPAGTKRVYDWHKAPGALERLLPPWQRITLHERSGGLGRGGRTELTLHYGPLQKRIVALHHRAVPGYFFEDSMERGPFALWHHRHFFRRKGDGCELEDLIRYRLPLAPLLPPALHRFVAKDLKKTFNYRHKITEHDLDRHMTYSRKPLRILISGASGSIGQLLVPFLRSGGHRVIRLVRSSPTAEDEIFWDPTRGQIEQLPEIDAVIHLAGEYIGLGRWNNEKKRRVIDSRHQGTTLLAKALTQLEKPPRVFLSASATGYYGHRDQPNLDESEPPGSEFISEVCKQWEEASLIAEKAGIRTIQLRLGVMLAAASGALQKFMQIGRIGFPRCFGSGKQQISWIDSNDAISAILHCLTTAELNGPINIVAPYPISNLEMLATLSKYCRKPLLPAVPERYITFFYGEMGREIALSGNHASAQKLLESGFNFHFPTLPESLAIQLGEVDE